MPVLQAVQPEKLATTLTAMSTALDGRGEQARRDAGRSSARTWSELNPSLPDVRADIRRLADVGRPLRRRRARTCSTALADLTTTTPDRRRPAVQPDATCTRTVTDRVGGPAATSCADNKENLIGLRRHLAVHSGGAGQVRAGVPLPAQGSWSTRCPAADTAFGKGTAHPDVTRVTIEITAGRGKYLPGVDDPALRRQARPALLPGRAPAGPVPAVPAAAARSRTARRSRRHRRTRRRRTSSRPCRSRPRSRPAAELAGRAGPDRGAARARPGLPPGEVPAWSSLLVGPLYRGAEVTRASEEASSAPLVKMLVFVLVTGDAHRRARGLTIANTDARRRRPATRARFTDATGAQRRRRRPDVRRPHRPGQRHRRSCDGHVRGRRGSTSRRPAGCPRTVTATIKYRNLVGQRYVSLGLGVGRRPRTRCCGRAT